MSRLTLSALALLIAATAAQAHTGVGNTGGILPGVAHPISGMDHVLAMVAVGLFAAHLGGRALWLVPLAFVSMMAVGGGLGMTGVSLPLVEIVIGLSVVVVGLAITTERRLPTVGAMALVASFAVFHGHAHGAETPEAAAGWEYGMGFVLATAGLHAGGISLGLLLRNMSEGHGNRAFRAVGSAVALGGIAILIGWA